MCNPMISVCYVPPSRPTCSGRALVTSSALLLKLQQLTCLALEVAQFHLQGVSHHIRMFLFLGTPWSHFKI